MHQNPESQSSFGDNWRRRFLNAAFVATALLVPLNLYVLFGLPEGDLSVFSTAVVYAIMLIIFSIIVAMFGYVWSSKIGARSSLIYTFAAGLVLFSSGVCLVWLLEVMIDFGAANTMDEALAMQLEWFTKGAFFDVTESFDFEIGDYESDRYPNVFNTMEMLFRFMYGFWSAYFIFVVGKKILTQFNSAKRG